MPYSKNPATYPQPLRDLLKYAANAKEQIEVPLPVTSRKQAIRYRALFYALRKAMMERAQMEGDTVANEKLASISMSLTQLPEDKAQLTVDNGYGGFSPDFLAAIADINAELREKRQTEAETPRYGELTQEQKAELNALATNLSRETEESDMELAQKISQYRPTQEAVNPYLTPEQEKDREEWKQYEESLDTSDIETVHSSHASPEQRKAAKAQREQRKKGDKE